MRRGKLHVRSASEYTSRCVGLLTYFRGIAQSTHNYLVFVFVQRDCTLHGRLRSCNTVSYKELATLRIAESYFQMFSLFLDCIDICISDVNMVRLVR